MARVLIREAHGGATRVIRDAALPYFLNSGWVIIDTLDDSTDASPLYLSKAESDFRYALKGAAGGSSSDPVLSAFVYDPSTGNLLSYKEDGVAIVLTYNPDGTVATSKRGTAAAQTYTYSNGNLVGVA